MKQDIIKIYIKSQRKHCDYICTNCNNIFSAPHRGIINKLEPKCQSCSQIKHNMSYSRLYNIWHNMKQRCQNPNNNSYSKYGAKNIKVINEWNTFNTFKIWAEKNGYSDNLTIDRKRSWLNYEPDNCQWISLKENSRKDSTRQNYGKSPHIKISPKPLQEIFKLFNENHLNSKEISKIYNVSDGHIRKLKQQYKKEILCQQI